MPKSHVFGAAWAPINALSQERSSEFVKDYKARFAT